MDLLMRVQNPDGSWPAFEGDDPEGCWVTALVLIALRFVGAPPEPIEKTLRWLLHSRGREGHWLWKWKFRTIDRRVQFDPDKYGWPWFPRTVSWVIPTALSLIALKQSLQCCPSEQAAARVHVGTEMLYDRACPEGGWNAGNGVVLGTALRPHIDTTAVSLLALSDDKQSPTSQAIKWLREASAECRSAYSLAWSAISLSAHQDDAAGNRVQRLIDLLSESHSLDIETLSLSAIAIVANEHDANPFEVRM